MALGVEHLQPVDLLADAGELDRRAGDLPHRQGRAAARIAIELGEDDAGERQRLLERLGRVDRVLALHGVHHEQGLDRVDRRVQFLDLAHHRLVDREAAGRVDQQHVEVLAARLVQRGAGDVHRLLVRRAREPLGPGLLRHRLQLLDGGRAVDVARHGQHLLPALLDQVLGQLGRGGRLARALQARHQDHRRRLGGEVDVGDALAHGGHQLVVHDAHQRLARVQRAHHLLPQRLLLDAGDEVAHHGQRHVGLQQRHADFAQHLLHVVLGDAGLAAHLLDEAGQFVGKGGGGHGWEAGEVGVAPRVPAGAAERPGARG